jgi:hypothetical protein
MEHQRRRILAPTRAGTIVHAAIDPERYATTFITGGDRYTVDTASLLAAI